MNLSLNLWAILVSGALHWVVGALWYSPLLFAKPWARAKGIDMSSPDHGASPLMYASGFLVGLVLAAGVAIVLDLIGVTSVPVALLVGAIMWLALNAAPTFANTVFGGSYVLWIIDACYPLVTTLATSVIVTLWR